LNTRPFTEHQKPPFVTSVGSFSPRLCIFCSIKQKRPIEKLRSALYLCRGYRTQSLELPESSLLLALPVSLAAALLSAAVLPLSLELVAAAPVSELTAALVSELAAAADSVVEELVVALEVAAAVLLSFLAQALAKAMTPAIKTIRATGFTLLISNMFAVLPEARLGS
jgi:hypothetical protein